MTLTDFLLARIAEDERDARKLAETDRRPVLSLATTVNHPARVLAECEAKRRIVAKGESMRDMASDAFSRGAAMAYETATRDLASVYADHSDYRDEYRP